MAVFDNIFRLRSPTAASIEPEGSTLDYVSPDASMGMFRGTMERFMPSDYLLPEGQGVPLYDPAAVLRSASITPMFDEEGMDYYSQNGVMIGSDRENRPLWANQLNVHESGQTGAATYARLLSGELPPGWRPKIDPIGYEPLFSPRIDGEDEQSGFGGRQPVYAPFNLYDYMAGLPTIEEYIASRGPGYLTPEGRVRGTTDNTPYDDYFAEYFNLPVNTGDWLTGAPIILGSLLLGGAAGGMFGGTAGAASSPALAGAVAGATQGGSQAAMTGGDFGDIVQGAGTGGALGFVGGGAGSTVGGMFDNPWVSQLASGATRGAVQGLPSGNALEGALQGVLNVAPGAVEGYVTDMFPSSTTPSYDYGADALAAPTSGLFKPLMSTADLEAFRLSSPMAMETSVMPLLDPELTQVQMGSLPVSEQLRAPTVAEVLAGTSNPIMQALAAESTEAPVTPAEEQSTPATEESLVTKETVQKVADAAKAVKKIYDVYKQLTGTSGSAPEFSLPPRQEGMSDEEYRALVSAEALDYLGLDADAMRAAGYEPGTQEYLDYILAQADVIIEAAFGDDPEALLSGESVEGLQQALRGKTEAEMQELARALYVRGALGGLTFRKSEIDPFTGELEYLGTQPGEAVEGSSAAAQRGYASFLEEAGGLTGPEARRAIRGMLGRDVDLFDLGKAAKDRSLQAMLAEFNADAYDEDEDQYERRGSRQGKRGRVRPAEQDSFWTNFFGGRR